MPAMKTLPETAAPHFPAYPLLALAGVVCAATAALWLHYGTAVFFEMIRNGFMACF